MSNKNIRRKEPFVLLSWEFRTLGQDPTGAGVVARCGCQEINLHTTLEKLIPKAEQSEERPITENKVGCVRDNDENRPRMNQVSEQSREWDIWFWESKLDASEEQRREWSVGDQGCGCRGDTAHSGCKQKTMIPRLFIRYHPTAGWIPCGKGRQTNLTQKRGVWIQNLMTSWFYLNF